MIKQFFECESRHGASPSVLAKDPPTPLAAGVAGTGAAPSIEVCFHHGIWDSYTAPKKLTSGSLPVYKGRKICLRRSGKDEKRRKP